MLGALVETTAVHTTGVNWEGVAAVVAALSFILTVVVVPVMRLIVMASVGQLIDSKVNPKLDEIRDDVKTIRETLARHDARIARLEGFQEGRVAGRVDES